MQLRLEHGVCTSAVCTRRPMECCELGRNTLRRELTGVVTIVATYFEKV